MRGDPIKYEVDKETGAVFVDRFMSTAMHYPCNYGYIPRTLSDDGDPCDVLVLSPMPLITGVVRPLPADRHAARWTTRRAATRRSSPCRSTSSPRCTATCSRRATCRRSRRSRSRISSSTTRISSRASGVRVGSHGSNAAEAQQESHLTAWRATQRPISPDVRRIAHAVTAGWLDVPFPGGPWCRRDHDIAHAASARGRHPRLPDQRKAALVAGHPTGNRGRRCAREGSLNFGLYRSS